MAEKKNGNSTKSARQRGDQKTVCFRRKIGAMQGKAGKPIPTV